MTYWMAPHLVRRYVRMELTRHIINNKGVAKVAKAERIELTGFHQASTVNGRD